MRSALVLCFMVASISALPAPRQRVETISGRVVAYSLFPGCVNGNGYWSMIILVQPAITSKLIRVDFSLPCDKSPEWISAKPSIQRFRLFREKERDAVLVGSMDREHKQGQNLALPIWKHPPDTEEVTLPFGQVLPCYRSADLPLAPVI